MEVNSLTIKTESLSIPTEKKAPLTVIFTVEYSKDYEGNKHMVDGQVLELAIDAAELFESKGMGFIGIEKPKKVVKKVE